MAVIEALAAGLAVITTPVGALGEILTDDDDALLVDPGSQTDLRRALERLISDPECRRRLGASGLSTYDRLFAPERLLEDIERVHKRALDRRESRPSTGRSCRESGHDGVP